MTRELLQSHGFPADLVTKAMERHPDSFLKAQRWLERHRDMLMIQHDLLTGLSADVAAASQANGGFIFGSPATAAVWHDLVRYTHRASLL